MTVALLSLLPPLIVIGAVLLRKPPIAACAAGGAAILLLIALGDFAHLPSSPTQSGYAALILTLSAALVIVPGLWLNALLREAGMINRLAAAIAALPLARGDKALILILGVAPAVESLTGFGVSLVLTVPIFLRLFPPPLAGRLALLGMNIMPWGTLALATAIGAALAGEDFHALGVATAQTSALVFPLIGVIGALLLDKKPRLCVFGALLGAALSLFLWIFNHYFFPETAGVFAGIAAALVGFVFAARESKNSAKDGGDLSLSSLSAVWPYALLLALVCAMRGIAPLAEWLSETAVLRAGGIAFPPLASPGLPLALTALVVLFSQTASLLQKSQLSAALRAAIKPVTAVFAFLAFAQLFRDGGFLTHLAAAASGGTASSGGALFSSALAIMSGYVTGSNVGGNALLMPIQAELGAAANAPLLWAAMQNSGAGHAVFASLPIIVLARAIAGEGKAESTAALARFTLKILPLIWLAVAVAGGVGMLL